MTKHCLANLSGSMGVIIRAISLQKITPSLRFPRPGITSILILFCAFLPSASLAQIMNASLQGSVKDTTGAAVGGAKVEAINTSTNITTKTETDAKGAFILPTLTPGGPYKVVVTASGFKTIVRSGIHLSVNQTSQLNFVLPVGAASSTILVNGDVTQLQTTTSSMGQVISNRALVNLPLNQRNVYALMFLEPGVTGSVSAAYNSLNLSVDGGKAGSSEILLDGIPATTPTIVPITSIGAFPSVDAVQEFKVMLTGYPAEFGRSGSGIINVILKSGTNKLHGSAYEFARNSVMDANTFFNDRNHTPLPHFSRNQFGVSLTGPVYIPMLYQGRNKTFFLFSYEGLREGSQANVTATVPTALQREGNFSQTLDSNGQQVIIYNPYTTTLSPSGSYVRQPFPNDTIPPQDINPVAAKFMNYYPLPNVTGTVSGQNNFFASGTSTENVNTYDAKIDEHFNDKNEMFARYDGHKTVSPPFLAFPKADQIAEGGITQSVFTNSAGIDYTHTFGQKLVTELSSGFARTAFSNIPVSLGFNPSTQLGLPSYIDANADVLVFPGFYPSSYYGLGDAGSGSYNRSGLNIFSFNINNTTVIGNNVIKFGGVDWIMQVNTNQTYDPTAEFDFDPGITQGPDPNVASPNAGNSIASALLGVGTGAQQIHQADVATTSKYYAAYIQDDWTALRHLTLNIGLRYDLDLPRTERYNRLETFDPNIPSPLASETGIEGLKGGVVFVGTSGASRRQFKPVWHDFSPRFGFAYELANNTVLHGGYNIYFNPSYRAAGGQAGSEGFGSSTQYVGSANGLTPSVFISDPFPNGINTPTGRTLGALTGIGTSFLNPETGDNRIGYTESWDVDLQRQIPFGILIDAAYVGSHGVHLLSGASTDYNANQLSPAVLQQGQALEQSVPNPFYGIIKTGPESGSIIARSYLEAPFPQFPTVTYSYPTGGYSDYNSFQFKMVKRLSSGLSAIVSYTDQKLIDNWSGLQNEGNITGGIQNIYNPKGERAVSSDNISQSFVASFVYDLPIGRGKYIGKNWGRTLGDLLGGWQMNAIITEQNGFPLSPITQNTSHSGSEVLRPNLTGISPVEHGSVISRLNQYLNPAAFSQPAPFTFGDAPRTLANVRAPGSHNVDFSLFKTIPVSRRIHAEFRGEFFNVLNQVQFGFPNMNLASGRFGVISGQANSPRQIQLAVKLLF
ncbi:MAG: TonB-dependent receptor domain-containing protein [Acidobacteriaceae bacterium]